MHLEEDPKRIAPRAWFQVMCIVSLVSNNLSRKHGFKQFIPHAWFQTVSCAPVLRDSFDLERLTTVTPLDLSPKNKQQQKSTATHINNRTNQEKQKSTETEINSNSEERRPPRSHQNASWAHRDASWSHQRNCQGGSLLMSVPVDVCCCFFAVGVDLCCNCFPLLLISVAVDFCCA